MNLNIDTGTALRRTGRLAELATAIYQASAHTPETHWVEWKSSPDFDSAAGRFAAAKAIIAFANRDSVTAARDCTGEAYLVVGVS